MVLMKILIKILILIVIFSGVIPFSEKWPDGAGHSPSLVSSVPLLHSGSALDFLDNHCSYVIAPYRTFFELLSYCRVVFTCQVVAFQFTVRNSSHTHNELAIDRFLIIVIDKNRFSSLYEFFPWLLFLLAYSFCIITTRGSSSLIIEWCPSVYSQRSFALFRLVDLWLERVACWLIGDQLWLFSRCCLLVDGD